MKRIIFLFLLTIGSLQAMQTMKYYHFGFTGLPRDFESFQRILSGAPLDVLCSEIQQYETYKTQTEADLREMDQHPERFEILEDHLEERRKALSYLDELKKRIDFLNERMLKAKR